jgi:hypothetical protein
MRRLLWIFIFLSLFSCRNDHAGGLSGASTPDTVIERSEMIKILTDVHLAEAAISSLKTKGDTSENLSADYYNAVFSKYKISLKNFRMNYDYYCRKPDEMIKMYEEVVNNLDALKKKNYAGEE